MSRVLLILVISIVYAKTASSETSSLKSDRSRTPQAAENPNVQKLISEINGKKGRTSNDEQEIGANRKSRNFGYPYYPEPFFNYHNQDLGYYFPQGKTPLSQEWRTEPFKRKNNPQQLLDSPVYYVRLPASPYVFVPGVGYVSRPPSLTDPMVLDALAGGKPAEEPSADSNFINLPLDFVSNGKPTSVYTLNKPAKPIDSNFYSLDKGPYLFNGKPIEFYFIRNSYNRLYADALTNFYP